MAGTQRGRVVNVERWNATELVNVEPGPSLPLAMGRGLSVDFALLRCVVPPLPKNVTPIPIAIAMPISITVLPTLVVLAANGHRSKFLS